MSEDEHASQPRPVKDAHKALGLWSIRRSLALAFSGATVLLVVAWFGVSWLLGSPPRDRPGPLDTAAQLELLKLVFALVAGTGALVALVTAYRRQRVDEAAGELAQRIARGTAHDATERRVTDLYGQAVEQLGHDKAPVRLGGLYSLERLAHDHPQHRQTITDVVCAYLRMPFEPPPEPDHARQELQVRLAAQRLLTTPLGQGRPATYWDGIHIDLTDAHLINFNFTHCRPATANFTSARFSGDTWFGGAQFNRAPWFTKAQFGGDVRFTKAQFNGDAWFGGARFDGNVWFTDANFSRNARFDEAQFNGTARFGNTQFDHEPDFTDATAGHPDDEHVWPAPWSAEVVTPETAKLIRRAGTN